MKTTTPETKFISDWNLNKNDPIAAAVRPKITNTVDSPNTKDVAIEKSQEVFVLKTDDDLTFDIDDPAMNAR